MEPARPARPRLLFLCQTLPYPPDGGVHLRTYNILRLLATEFEITALCFYRRSERATTNAVQESLDGLAPLASTRAFPIPQEHSRGRLLMDHLRSTIRREAYTLTAYASDAFAAAVEQAVRHERPALVHMDSLDLAAYLPLLSGVPVICTHHNVESQLIRRRAQAEPSVWRRWYMHQQANWLEKMERQLCPRLALNLAVSDADRRILESFAPGARFLTVSNGVDVEYFRPQPERGRKIIFVGGINWFPNRDALNYFCADILPHLRSTGEAEVQWAGRSDPEAQARFRRDYGIELTGYVTDVRPLIGAAACYVVPLRVGGGTRLKILDAWAMGKAVVSTSIGCEGLDARDGENILIRDTPKAFAEAITRVLNDDGLRNRLGRAARATAEATYSWPVIGKTLIDGYRHLLDGSPSVRVGVMV